MESSVNFYKEDIDRESIWLNKEYLVQLNLTGSCPLKCEFCYAAPYKKEFLSLDKIKKLWKNLRKYYIEKGIEYRVNLTGGDIFDHPDWTKIAKFVSKEKSIVAVDPLINRFWKKNHLMLNILNAFGMQKKILKTFLRNKTNLEGKIAAQGKAEAKAFVTNNPYENPPFEEYILVTQNSSLEMLPLVYKAKGIISETGGLMCHLAVIARELKIPCIVSCKKCYTALKTGYFLKIYATSKLNSKVTIEYDI